MSSSIIFINSSPQKTLLSINNKRKLFRIVLKTILFRIFVSFVPPIIPKFRKVYIDLIGPLIALIVLHIFISFSCLLKSNQLLHFEPIKSVLLFVVCMPIFCYILCKFGKSKITFYEILALSGYSLYGHLFTLIFSSLYQQNFFIFLVIFGGLSTLRIIMVFLSTIPLPVARLLICSLISIVNILYLVFLHVIIMHKTCL